MLNIVDGNENMEVRILHKLLYTYWHDWSWSFVLFPAQNKIGILNKYWLLFSTWWSWEYYNFCQPLISGNISRSLSRNSFLLLLSQAVKICIIYYIIKGNVPKSKMGDMVAFPTNITSKPEKMEIMYLICKQFAKTVFILLIFL